MMVFALIIDLSFIIIFILRILLYETTIIIPLNVAKRWMAWPQLLFLGTSLVLVLAWNIDWCKGNQLSRGFGNIENMPIVLLDSLVWTRLIYDRVWKRKNYFEIPAFLQIERGKSRVGKFKTSNENKFAMSFITNFHTEIHKHTRIPTQEPPSLFSFDFEFPALEVPCS